MRAQLIDRLTHRQPGFAQYLIAIFRILHGITAILPGITLISLLESHKASLATDYPAMLLFFALLSVLVFQVMGVYNDALFSNLLRFQRMLAAWAAAFCLLLFMHQQMQLFNFISSWQLAMWFGISLALFGTERLVLLYVLRRLIARGHYLNRAVILGCTENGLRMAEYLRQNGDIRCGVIGFIDDRIERTTHAVNGIPVLGNQQHLENLIRAEQVSQVLVALPWSAETRIDEMVTKLRRLPVNVLLVPDMLAFRHAHNRISEVAGLPLFNASSVPLSGWAPLIKRCEDLLLASLGICLLLPFMLLIAAAIKLDSKGPVLFRQKRYGYNHQLIEVFKFRSMYQAQSDANATRQTTRDDPRITRVGRFIRRTSLDELPQLLNVLLGNMSMVGPRPHATATKAAGVLFEDAGEAYSARHRVKPGITGWAQINGYRGETDTLEKIERRVELDLEYIESWSVGLDLKIILLTIPAILTSKEVY